MSKFTRFWQHFTSWDEASKAWDLGASQKKKEHPLKILQHNPDMVGISKDAKRLLKWKSLWYLITHDQKKIFKRFIFKHPIRHLIRFLSSVFKKKAYRREDDFFFYGINNLEEFISLIGKKDTLFVIGFSYCHKPHECPSKRFSNECIHDPEHPVCRQCFIGKAVNSLPEKGVIPLFIPTIHYIGEKMLKIREQYPEKTVCFLITACEMTLEMFGDWGNMAAIQGIGVRLAGRICNTMKAFELSEEGIKPGLTIVEDKTQVQILEILKHLRTCATFEKV